VPQAGAYEPGHGHFALFGFAERAAAGGGLDYAHRLTPALSAFARGWGGIAEDPLGRWRPDYGAIAGLRMRW
jgi:hypothetical protein